MRNLHYWSMMLLFLSEGDNQIVLGDIMSNNETNEFLENENSYFSQFPELTSALTARLLTAIKEIFAPFDYNSESLKILLQVIIETRIISSDSDLKEYIFNKQIAKIDTEMKKYL